MYEEMKGRKATCPSCKYEYDGNFEMHRQDVKAVIEDGECTWCYAFRVEGVNPVAIASQKTLQVMGF